MKTLSTNITRKVVEGGMVGRRGRKGGREKGREGVLLQLLWADHTGLQVTHSYMHYTQSHNSCSLHSHMAC